MVNPEQPDITPVEAMDLSGGDVCLDFVNTASGRAEGELREKLRTYADLVTWAERVGIVDGSVGGRLRAAATAVPDHAAEVLERGRALREAIYRLFTAEAADPEDLELLSAEAGRAARERRLVADAEGYAYAWPAGEDLGRTLWPIALAAADLLTSPDRERVKECDALNCSWLFLDMSRNRSRRWCDMKVCGNRAKARRFAERNR